MHARTHHAGWHAFCFSVALQRDGPFSDCWMVESVTPAGPGGCSEAECGAGDGFWSPLDA